MRGSHDCSDGDTRGCEEHELFPSGIGRMDEGRIGARIFLPGGGTQAAFSSSTAIMETTTAELTMSAPAPAAAEAPAHPQGMSRTLGPRVTADYEALRNDLEMAQEIAADFQ